MKRYLKHRLRDDAAMMYDMSEIKKAWRIHVWETRLHKCFYCGLPFKTLSEATIDHLHPLALGGKWEDKNLALACAQCNARKGKMTLKEYLATHPGHERNDDGRIRIL